MPVRDRPAKKVRPVAVLLSSVRAPGALAQPVGSSTFLSAAGPARRRGTPQDAAADADLAMAGARRLLRLWLGCLCVSLAHGQRLKQHFPELREPVPGDRTAGGGPDPLPQPLDKVSEHMLRLYDRYSGGGRAEAARTPGSSERGSPPLLPQPLREGNTVRSFRAADITQLLRKAKENEEFLIGFNITSKGHQLPKKITPFPEPYILVYANDIAISEPKSVVSSLQGHRNFPTGAVPKLDSHIRAALSTERRKKRSTGVLLPLQNNELPGAEYQYKEDGVWEERKPYKTLQTQPPEKSKNKKKQRKGPHQKSQTLQFDEQTLKKARRKQWIEPRNCARRYLKVDFADIGWSEWIISPKSFDAYYCSGACQFPMPKSLKPSNHATIQSIVRAVGVVPGIPEPCCVPEKMSSLSILFFDENKNVVLKVYPNMTVESCACR
ncbi:hypothetical protein J1605_022751 [Eschrichtius robustus]|uniref:Bone morphogenetic protein 3 n=1 Tax=Eschrichtius robustus TaxID=9764 RepID=A0AB34H9V4_ESCRO|nr:hypothetical protein J1605_022751 [Eschrichtius robustus]